MSRLDRIWRHSWQSNNQVSDLNYSWCSSILSILYWCETWSSTSAKWINWNPFIHASSVASWIFYGQIFCVTQTFVHVQPLVNPSLKRPWVNVVYDYLVMSPGFCQRRSSPGLWHSRRDTSRSRLAQISRASSYNMTSSHYTGYFSFTRIDFYIFNGVATPVLSEALAYEPIRLEGVCYGDSRGFALMMMSPKSLSQLPSSSSSSSHV